jgi:hypothetical protein
MKNSSNCVFFATTPETKAASMQMAVSRPVLMVYAMIVVRIESVLWYQAFDNSVSESR